MGNVALCDNVYKDAASNKVILAGLYSGDILLEAIPAEFRISLYVEVYLPNQFEHNVHLQFYDGKKLRGGAMVVASVLDPGSPASLILPQFSLPVLKPFRFEVRLALDDGPSFRILRKTIGVYPSASQPPSEQD